MALTTFFMAVVLVTIASAGAQWPGGNPFAGFPDPMMMLRQIPTPAPPRMPFPFSFFPFPMPTMPAIPFPSIPTPEEIANASPANGGTYSGIVVSSQSGKKSGTSILVNQDGKVMMSKTGDGAPEILTKPVPLTNTTAETFDFDNPELKPSKPFKGNFKSKKFHNNFNDFPHVKPFGFPAFEPIQFPTFKPFDVKYKPSKNEKFSGQRVSSSSFVVNNNGVKKQGATLSRVENDNGVVKEENIIIHNDDSSKL